MGKLTRQQQIFCDEYLIDLNATRAYKVAYPNIKNDASAAACSSRLLTIAKVEAYVEERMKDREKRTEITQDMVLQELAKIALSDFSDFAKIVEREVEIPQYDDTGAITGTRKELRKVIECELTDDIAADKRGVISSVKSFGDNIEVKLHDKLKALDMLSKHLGMYTEKIDINVGTSEKFATIISQLGGDGLEE